MLIYCQAVNMSLNSKGAIIKQDSQQKSRTKLVAKYFDCRLFAGDYSVTDELNVTIKQLSQGLTLCSTATHQ